MEVAIRMRRSDGAPAAGGAKTSCTSESSRTIASPSAQLALTPSTAMAKPSSGTYSPRWSRSRPLVGPACGKMRAPPSSAENLACPIGESTGACAPSSAHVAGVRPQCSPTASPRRRTSSCSQCALASARFSSVRRKRPAPSAAIASAASSLQPARSASTSARSSSGSSSAAQKRRARSGRCVSRRKLRLSPWWSERCSARAAPRACAAAGGVRRAAVARRGGRRQLVGGPMPP